MSYQSSPEVQVFNLARAAGMTPDQAARYVRYLKRCSDEARAMLTPQQAAEACKEAAK